MTTIYLIRHAQADGNLYRRCQAWYDSLVTPAGYEQIKTLENRFLDTHFDAVYSSDSFRTMTTAKAICLPHDLPLHTDPALREVNSGVWEDRPWGEILHADRESLLAFWRCDPAWQAEGSETFEEIQKRFDGAVKRIASAHPEQTIAVFAHGCIIRSTLAMWLGLPLSRITDVPHGYNTSVAKLTYQDGTINVHWYNDISHLPAALTKAAHPAAESGDTLARTCVYFRPMDLPNCRESYLEARRNAWVASHGTESGFDGEAFLGTAMACYENDPNSVLTAMLDGKEVGILQMDFAAEAAAEIGIISFIYMSPKVWDQGLGVQLIGQAVSSYRALGRKYLRLRCAPENHQMQSFYKKYGFYKVGEEPGDFGILDTLEKYIGTEHP